MVQPDTSSEASVRALGGIDKNLIRLVCVFDIFISRRRTKSYAPVFMHSIQAFTLKGEPTYLCGAEEKKRKRERGGALKILWPQSDIGYSSRKNPCNMCLFLFLHRKYLSIPNHLQSFLVFFSPHSLVRPATLQILQRLQPRNLSSTY